MSAVVRYGADSQLTLELPADRLVAQCGLPAAEPLDDPAAAMGAALCDPLDYPPLKLSVIAGDQVTVALDPHLPQAAALVAGVVDTLLSAGIRATDITLLRTETDAQISTEDPRDLLSPAVAADVTLLTHDPAQQSELRYLAASREGKPIYLHRAIHEADLVLPIGCLRVDTALGYHGIHGGLFPTFSDARTQRRFRSPRGAHNKARRQQRRHEADEVAWLLGLSFTIQVVPAPAGQVLHILAGEVTEVLRRGRELCRHAWLSTVPRRAALVVATLEGPQREQNWENVARALSTARTLVADGGAIALCTDLADVPGPMLRRVGESDDLLAVRQEIGANRTVEALPAAELFRAQRQAKVYLLSRLEEDVVEELGLGHIDNARELGRLSSQFDSCIVLSNAQYAMATTKTDTAL